MSKNVQILKFRPKIILSSSPMVQSSSKEDHNTFRTTPQEHWWIWPECPS